MKNEKVLKLVTSSALFLLISFLYLISLDWIYSSSNIPNETAKILTFMYGMISILLINIIVSSFIHNSKVTTKNAVYFPKRELSLEAIKKKEQFN